MLTAEIIILCMIFFFLCYCKTGSDEKNIKSYSSYPDEIQHIVRESVLLKDKIKPTAPLTTFLSNIAVFTVVLFLFGFFIKQAGFTGNFVNLLIIGQSLNLFDFIVIDMLWWRKSKRVRFTGTEDMEEAYSSPKKHFKAFIRGILAFLIIAIIGGLLLSLI